MSEQLELEAVMNTAEWVTNTTYRRAEALS